MSKVSVRKIGYVLIILFGVSAIAGAYLLSVSAQRQRDMKVVPLSDRASFLNTKQSMASIAVPHLEAMIEQAEKDGMCMVVTSGYRTRARQQQLYDQAADKSIVAMPGTSEHETGLAVDLGGCPMADGRRDDKAERLELKKDFNELPEYQWLLDNAARYGFEQSYTEANKVKTGMPPEPWHWKYQYK